MKREEFIQQVEMKGLMLGAELSPEVVSKEICPQCPLKTPFCQWMLEKVWLPDSNVGFVCKGMRAWVTKSD